MSKGRKHMDKKSYEKFIIMQASIEGIKKKWKPTSKPLTRKQ